MAHFRHHQPLDDEELRMSLDEDMRALEALGAEDPDVDVDINMDMDAVEALDGLDDQQLKQDQLKREELRGDDGDVFRPSAMLDRRMEEEWVGGAFYSTCFQASELVEKDLDGGFVDIEQMLLSESEEFLTAHFANTSDDQLHAQLLDGANSGDQSDNQQRQRMIRAEITARHFLHAKRNANGDNDSDATQLQQQRLVLLKQAIASSSLSSSSIFNMPPKYFEGGVQSSPQKRRAYRRTFGERTQPFTFGSSSSSTFSFKQEDQQSARMTSDCYHQIGGSGSTFNDENCPPHPSAASLDEVRIKEEIVDASAHQGVPRATATVYASESEIESMDEGHGDEEELKAAAEANSRAQTPVTLAPFTGFRSISDDLHQYNNDEDEHEVTRTTLRTPLRRSLSSPAPSIAAEQQFTPQQQQHLSGGHASRSMSPADAFEKVAVVLQVANDSPGRVDKFEWRIGGSAQTQNQQQQQGSNASSKKRPNLSTQLGKADAILRSNSDGSLSSCPSSELDDNRTNTTAAAATLPPRYFRGVTSSPQKRRAHSTTFGSFARSFSFTGSSGPPNDL